MYFLGSPVKAEILSVKRKLSDDYFADPRPAKYRNKAGFNDRVRNIVINYCSQLSKDISFRYLIPKADVLVYTLGLINYTHTHQLGCILEL